jgi:tRNA (guanine-N7-)-methyltransferase
MRVRQHVNPLHWQFEQFKGQLPPFVDGRLVEVEIGCADAQFLFERAKADPSRLYVGLEIREELVDWVNRKAKREGAPVHAVFCQAQKHIPTIFGDVDVERVYLNFPDPWFKKRHHERRMIDDALISGVAQVLRPGGELLVQTDVWDIAIDAMEVIERRDEWFSNCAPEGDWSFWRAGNPFGAQSWREMNAAAEGLPVWRILYRRQ